ncbi:MAG: ISAzo13 family transposase, partial [Bacteroidetes bacterium]|nr:ISAzo13 family transposase [Bacteroidota bacterium]
KRKNPGPKKLSPYSEDIEQYIKNTYNQLSEKDRRQYAAVEVLKLPRGGISYLARLLDCSRNTIAQGISDLKKPEGLEKGRVRKKGAGRKSAIDNIVNINTVFLKVIENYIAGDPMNGDIRWTNLSHKKIAERMQTEGIVISVTVVKKLLKKHGFVKRKALKKQRIGSSKHRNDQFEKIARLKQEYFTTGNPVISVDTKKKNS